MPRSDDSSPNFDFLSDDSGSSGVGRSDSATNLLEPSAPDATSPFDFGDDAADDGESPTSGERPPKRAGRADRPTRKTPKREAAKRGGTRPPARKTSPEDDASAEPSATGSESESAPSRTPFGSDVLDPLEADDQVEPGEEPAIDVVTDEGGIAGSSPDFETGEDAADGPSRSRSRSKRSRPAERSETENSADDQADAGDDEAAKPTRPRRGTRGGSRREKSSREKPARAKSGRETSSRSERRGRETEADDGSDSVTERTRSRRGRRSSGIDWEAIDEAGLKPLLYGVVGYAALATLLAVGVLMFTSQPRSPLEDLPDVPPRDRDAFQYYGPSVGLPPSHVLPLGQAADFGFIRIRPVAVRYGDPDLQHYRDRSLEPPDMGGRTLLMELELQNLSPLVEGEGQQIAPLDRELVYERVARDDRSVASNQYIYRPGDAEPVSLMLPLSSTSEFEVQGRPLERLKPGETQRIVLAADPAAAASLSGSYLWRVQLRKGYHPASGNGVTTLVDIPFSTPGEST